MNDRYERPRGWKEDLLPYLCGTVEKLLAHVDAGAPLEEIRIRAGQPVQLCFAGYERMLGGRDAVTAEECAQLLTRFCGQSVYAREEELKSGYLTLPGGYRVGLCGRAVMLGGSLQGIAEITSFNIRIARAVPGCAADILQRLLGPGGRLFSTLIVSAPGCGKTTMLRDLSRLCAEGGQGARPHKVAVVDTRYELAGCIGGRPRLDVGPRTDVLSGVPKAQGMRMMVLNMAPDLLVTDELASFDEARAAFDAIRCGVSVAASAHALSAASLLSRRSFQLMLRERLFERIVLLGRGRGAGTVEQVYDGSFRELETGGAACSVKLLC